MTERGKEVMKNSNNYSELDRDIRFDILRAIGLLCVILAHVSPPAILDQMRNFDVPLMVIVSSAVYGLSKSAKNRNYMSYLKDRFIRLVVPTWIFLLFFFLLAYLFSKLINKTFPFSVEIIITSFSLDSGIGYVWIIKVFLLTALVMPLLMNLYKATNSTTAYLIIICMFYVFYELFYYIYSHFGISSSILNNYFLYLLPYGCVAGFGLVLPQIKNKIAIVSAISGLYPICRTHSS
jgi:fucose 4-O-acetylase-like acetyltransferase